MEAKLDPWWDSHRARMNNDELIKEYNIQVNLYKDLIKKHKETNWFTSKHSEDDEILSWGAVSVTFYTIVNIETDLKNREIYEENWLDYDYLPKVTPLHLK